MGDILEFIYGMVCGNNSKWYLVIYIIKLITFMVYQFDFQLIIDRDRLD